MKASKGFISIIALIVMSVILVMALYLSHTTKLGYLILGSTKNSIQSYYQAEGKIYMSIYEENYYLNQLYPILTKFLRTFPFHEAPKEIIIYNEDLEYGDEINRIKVIIVGDKTNSTKELKLIAESNHEGVKTKITSSITLFNELYERGDPVLSPSLMESQYKENLDELINNIYKNINIADCDKPSNMYGMESLLYDKILLHKKDNINFEVLCSRDDMINPYIEGFNTKNVFIIVKESGRHVKLYIGDPNKLEEEIEVSGILYVEGDIIISSKFKFNGIILIKGGSIIVETENKPKINGIVIFDDLLDYNVLTENVDIVYDRYYIYKYGTFLPGFIEPKIKSIKSN